MYAGGYDEEETHGQVISDILSGQLDASKFYDIDQVVPLEDINSAFDSLRDHKALKYIISLK